MGWNAQAQHATHTSTPSILTGEYTGEIADLVHVHGHGSWKAWQAIDQQVHLLGVSDLACIYITLLILNAPLRCITHCLGVYMTHTVYMYHSVFKAHLTPKHSRKNPAFMHVQVLHMHVLIFLTYLIRHMYITSTSTYISTSLCRRSQAANNNRIKTGGVHLSYNCLVSACVCSYTSMHKFAYVVPHHIIFSNAIFMFWYNYP